MLAFIIPVRHPANARDWSELKANLQQTSASIAAQDNKEWRAVVVANDGADLPILPPGFDVKRVDFAPNPQHDFAPDRANRDAVIDAIRLDKGRRVLAGMLHARVSDYFMVVDDDDFVSRRLAGFIDSQHGAFGWCLRKGYVWTHGGRLLYLHPAFHEACGTSHIVRADLMGLPERAEDATEAYIKRTLGSHRSVDADLDAQGTALADLPFAGAIYRVGHDSSHSQTRALLRNYIFRKSALRQPRMLIENAFRMRVLTAHLRHEFFAE